MISFEYDNTYEPPMPVASVTVSHPEQAKPAIECVALLDTGADATMLPAELLETIHAPLVGDAHMRGVIGVGEIVDVYLVRVQIGAYHAGGIRAVAMPGGSEPILGRDVLNNFIITLNGLANVVEITP